MSVSQSQQSLLVDVPTAARMLGVSPRTLYSLTAPRGELRSIRIGPARRLVRYRIDDLQAYVDRLTTAVDVEL